MNKQQEVDKHAKIAMVIISGIIIFLFIIALSGCKFNEEPQWEEGNIKHDTNIYFPDPLPWFNPDSINNFYPDSIEVEDPYPYETGDEPQGTSFE